MWEGPSAAPEADALTVDYSDHDLDFAAAASDAEAYEVLSPALSAWATAKRLWHLATNEQEALAAADAVAAVIEDADGAIAHECHQDLQQLITATQTDRPRLFTSAVQQRLDAVVVAYLTRAATTADTLKPVVMREVMHFLSLPELGTLARLSKSWRQLSEHDYLWREPYKARFNISDSSLAVGPDAAATPPLSCKEAFARRLLHPQVGDRVEVAWRGKFRLESLEVFSGLAWWLADVVARSDDCRRYKVHYPGWEPRWDEWVSRERLRWGNDARAARLLGHPVEVGDTVEVWCGGVHVPGAWLEGRVSCIRSDRAYLGDMLAAGTFSIPLARCRLVRKGELMARGEEEGETVRRRSLNVACMAAPCGCSVM